MCLDQAQVQPHVKQSYTQRKDYDSYNQIRQNCLNGYSQLKHIYLNAEISKLKTLFI